jgi:hypothetical protein
MKWPFRRKREETDLRIFRHPKTDELTLHMAGSIGWPSAWEQPILQIGVTLTTPLTESVARQLRDQLNVLVHNDQLTSG